MRYINNLSEELEVFKALGSEVRISILNLLLERGKMSMNELAEQLNITNGAMTNHIRKLESADLIRVTSDPNVHGNLKLCEPHLDKILFILTAASSTITNISLICAPDSTPPTRSTRPAGSPPPPL